MENCSSPRVCLAVVSIRPVFGRFWVRLPWANQILHVIVYVATYTMYLQAHVLTRVSPSLYMNLVIMDNSFRLQSLFIQQQSTHVKETSPNTFLAPTGRRLGTNFFLLFRFVLFFVSTNFTICIQKTTLLTEVRMLHSFSCCEAFLCTK